MRKKQEVKKSEEIRAYCILYNSLINNAMSYVSIILNRA